MERCRESVTDLDRAKGFIEPLGSSSDPASEDAAASAEGGSASVPELCEKLSRARGDVDAAAAAAPEAEEEVVEFEETERKTAGGLRAFMRF